MKPANWRSYTGLAALLSATGTPATAAADD
jgi:hypothetical protein